MRGIVKHNGKAGLPALRTGLRAAAFAVSMLMCAGLCGQQASNADHRTLRVMTYNIHHGEGTDGIVDIDRLTRFILDSRADIVLLEEVDRRIDRSKNIDILAVLAERTGMQAAFCKTLDFRGGQYGNGILTRFRIKDERAALFAPHDKRERRGMLRVLLDVDGAELAVAVTHLDEGKNEAPRLAMRNELDSLLALDAELPAIVGGDFNASPDDSVIACMGARWHDSWALEGPDNGYTFPSTGPGERIDYLFTSKKLGPMVNSVEVRCSNASDHCALIGEFTLELHRTKK